MAGDNPTSGVDSTIYSPTEASKLPCGVFKRIQIVTQPLGGTLLAWELHQGFGAYGPFHFFVDFSRANDSRWETLNEQPVIDDCVFMDLYQRYFDHLADFYYRVRLLLPNEPKNPDGSCKFYQSQPQQANGIWSKRDWLLAREICRKEYLLQRKRTNITAVGYILKRRRFGSPCKQCLDFDTQEVGNSRCPQCFGTGFIGGYYPALDLTVTPNAPWQREFKRDGQVSLRNDIIRQARAVSYPFPDTKDVFVKKDTGERFYVNSIQTLAEVGSIPVVISLELRLAPVTDIAYTVPLTGFQSSSSSSSPSSSSLSSSSSSSEKCDWRVGSRVEPAF